MICLEIASVYRVAEFSLDLLTMGGEKLQVLFEPDQNIKAEEGLMVFKILFVIRVVVLSVDFHQVLTLYRAVAAGFPFGIFNQQILTKLIR